MIDYQLEKPGPVQTREEGLCQSWKKSNDSCSRHQKYGIKGFVVVVVVYNRNNVVSQKVDPDFAPNTTINSQLNKQIDINTHDMESMDTPKSALYLYCVHVGYPSTRNAKICAAVSEGVYPTYSAIHTHTHTHAHTKKQLQY